jgi:hypothetical protein
LHQGEQTIEGKGGDDAKTDTNTIAIGIREGDEEKEEIINGDSL